MNRRTLVLKKEALAALDQGVLVQVAGGTSRDACTAISDALPECPISRVPVVCTITTPITTVVEDLSRQLGCPG